MQRHEAQGARGPGPVLPPWESSRIKCLVYEGGAVVSSPGLYLAFFPPQEAGSRGREGLIGKGKAGRGAVTCPQGGSGSLMAPWAGTRPGRGRGKGPQVVRQQPGEAGPAW